MFKVLSSYIHSELIFTSLYKFRSSNIVVHGIVGTYIERERARMVCKFGHVNVWAASAGLSHVIVTILWGRGANIEANT